MTTDDSVFSSFRPLYYINLFFCLTRVTKDGETYKFNQLSILFGLINLVLIAAGIALYILKSDLYTIDNSGVYYWSFLVFNLSIALRMISIYILRIYTYDKEKRLFGTIDKFDRQMIKMGKSKEILSVNKTLFQYSIASIPMSLVTYLFSEFYINAIENSGITWFLIISRFIGTYVGILAKFQFYLWCIAIRDRFAMVNQLILKIKEKFQMSNMFVVSVYKYEQCIEQYSDLHRDLTHMARQMNEIFQFDLLWHFFIMFIVIFTNAYYSAFMMLKNKDEMNLTSMFANSLFIFIEIVLNIQSSTALCNESYKALEAYNNLKIDPDDSSAQKLVISSIFEFKENRLEITACRFFNVNFSTLSVMMIIITNYVFILIQFEDTNAGSPTNGSSSA